MLLPRILILLLALCAVLRAADPKPNIVLILADDLGINDLSCYGRKDQSTPRIDTLAAQGMRFTSAYCAQPITSASQAALLTGKCPARLHLTNVGRWQEVEPSQKVIQPRTDWALQAEEITLAELLRDAGYTNASIGNGHLMNLADAPARHLYDLKADAPISRSNSTSRESKNDVAFTDAALRFIKEKKDTPFFCLISHQAPHLPYEVPPGAAEKHAGAFNPTYAAALDVLDECVGRVMEKLEILGLTERTVFIFASYNGGAHVPERGGTPATHNTPFRAGKGFVYEGGLRVPLIVRWPGHVKAGSTSDAPMVLTDLMPTLLEAAGIDAAKTVGPLDGVSTMKTLNGGDPGARTLFWHCPHYTSQGGRPAGAMREGNWKLVLQDEDGSAELYDLARDIGEMNDLAKAEPERVATMRGKLEAWRKSVGARATVPNPKYYAAIHDAVYVARDPSRIPAAATAAQIEQEWRDWSWALVKALGHDLPRIRNFPAEIRLFAKDATVHGTQARYESASYKNVIGFWTNPEDWAEWDFEVKTAGRYEVEVQQGCAGGGSEVDVEVAGQKLAFTVENTGHFQQMISRTIGVVELPAGKHTIAIKPRTKQGPAVMDLRRVVLRSVSATGE